MADRSSQIVAEILDIGHPYVRVSQLFIAAQLQEQGAVSTRVSQLSQEIALQEQGAVSTRVTQQLMEVLLYEQANVRCSWLALEILIIKQRIEMPLVYPTLIGLGYSVVKRPIFATGVAEGASMREVRVSFADNNIWEWDLVYEYLPDAPPWGNNGTTASDLKTMMGFFLGVRGSFKGFLFWDPDDNYAYQQGIATTDGEQRIFLLYRKFGEGIIDVAYSAEVPQEPVGYVRTESPFHAYLDGDLVDPGLYTVDRTTPNAQMLTFTEAPAAGQVLKVTMNYYFFCRFKEDQNDFEKFVNQIWSIKKITIRSVKGIG